MITGSARSGGQPRPRRLLAFHYSSGYESWNSLAGYATVPALVYEVTETVESGGSILYEGRIFDAATAEMIHERPYQSTFLEAFARWWSRETGLEPPKELLSSRSGSGIEHHRLDYGG